MDCLVRTLYIHHMGDRSVLISGASIAGPALAYWLHVAGYEPTIVERAQGPRPGGQTVDLRGAGRTVVTRMGLMNKARSVAVDQRGLALVNGTGKFIATMPVGAFGGEGIVSEIEILRGDLADVLRQATLPGTEYIYDDTVTGFAQDDEGVTVTFENRAPRRYGLVFGADGVHSAVRSVAFGPESEFFRPLNVCSSWFTGGDDWDLDGWLLMYNEPGGLVASVRPGRLSGEIKASLAFRTPPVTFDHRDTTAQKQLMTQRFSASGWEIPRLVRAMHDSPDFVLDNFGQVRMDTWSRGRVALVGDAAWCPTALTGLGTSLALVGAYVLAGELAGCRGDYQQAFTRYEELMRSYVTKSQQLPPGGVAGFAPKSSTYIALRAKSMRMMTHWPMKNLIASQFAKAKDLELPDYELSPIS
jgi:2-polyprenyl-6-methoxyphenol hydroxylase-like FAD-dependent oxidoreductase